MHRYVKEQYSYHLPKEVTSDETWDFGIKMYQDIVVKVGATLTITCEVLMPIQGQIIVEPGATLIVDGGTIKNAHDELWSGIRVMGQVNQHQYTYGAGQYHQGRAILRNNAVIENAHEGIQNWMPGNWDSRGGIIQASNSDFINCRIAAIFMKYQNHAPSNPAINMPDQSYFRACNFILDDDYLGDPNQAPPRPRITLWKTDRVRIAGCNFINNQTVNASEKRVAAIYSENANYLVTERCTGISSPCAPQNIEPSTFSGWHKAIEATGAGGGRPIMVRNSIFTDNMIGVEVNGADYSQIYKNTFEMGGHPFAIFDDAEVFDENHLGIYANSTQHFSIEENTLSRPQQGAPYEGHGVLVYNSGGAENQVYKNSLSRLKTGVNGWQVNLNINIEGGATFGQAGLQFICNTNAQNEVDFEMSRTENLDDPSEFPNSGIRLRQGNNNPPRSASNTFSAANSDPLVFTHFTVGSSHDYNYWSNGSLPQPAEIGPGLMNTHTSTATNNCPSNYTTGVVVGPSGKTQLLAQKGAYEGLFYAYQQLIDDGNTPGSVTEIELTWPSQAWDLRDELMLRAPFNSETVLIAAIDRNIMPHAMLLEVLLANPDALRSGTVIRHAELVPSPPMPVYMIDLLWASRNQATLRTAMESTLADLHEQVQRTQKIILTQKAFADSTYSAPDSTLYYLSLVKTVEGNYSRAAAYADRDMYTHAIDLLDSMQVHYRLSPERDAEMTGLKYFYSLLGGAHASGKTIANLDSIDIQGLVTIAENGSAGLAARKSQNALCFHYDICFNKLGQPKINNSVGIPKPSYEELITKLNTSIVFPNPADGHLTVSYTLLFAKLNTSLEIYDATGRKVEERTLGETYEGQQLFDTRKFASGVFLYHIVQEGRKVSDGKFVITH